MGRFRQAQRGPCGAVGKDRMKVQIAGEDMIALLGIREDQPRGRRRAIVRLRHELGGSFAGHKHTAYEHRKRRNHCVDVFTLGHKTSQ